MDAGAITARNIDMPRLCRFRPKKSEPTRVKVDKKCLEGRCYEGYKAYIVSNMDVSIVEMDTILGKKTGKVLLALHLMQFNFMIVFIRDRNTSQSVIDCFILLRKTLKPKMFSDIKVLLWMISTKTISTS